jgi:cyanamide hydratase family protein with HD domain
MHGTHMSFEYYGAFKALNFLRDNGAPQDQAEAVSEAIIRHADLGETGTLSSLGMMIQLSTVFGKFSLSYFLLRQYCCTAWNCVESVRRIFTAIPWPRICLGRVCQQYPIASTTDLIQDKCDYRVVANRMWLETEPLRHDYDDLRQHRAFEKKSQHQASHINVTSSLRLLRWILPSTAACRSVPK